VAIKPTIYKIKISLSDFNRDYYDTLNLTVAQHPSETIERMMVRVLAYCINAQEYLIFTKGLSAVDEPDIWARTLDDQISLWIDVGEIAIDRVKKASRQASAVKIYCFNTKSDVWWKQINEKMTQLKVSVFRFDWDNLKILASFAQRTMEISISISGESLFISTESGGCEVNCTPLQE